MKKAYTYILLAVIGIFAIVEINRAKNPVIKYTGFKIVLGGVMLNFEIKNRSVFNFRIKRGVINIANFKGDIPLVAIKGLSTAVIPVEFKIADLTLLSVPELLKKQKINYEIFAAFMNINVDITGNIDINSLV